jgi:hypothetical protein
METVASFEARYAPSSYPTHWRPREVSRHYGRPAPQCPGREGPPTLQERHANLGEADTKERRITWAVEANQISGHRCASGKS